MSAGVKLVIVSPEGRKLNCAVRFEFMALMSAPHSSYLYHLIHYFVTLESVLEYFNVCFDVVVYVDEIEGNRQKLTKLENMVKL